MRSFPRSLPALLSLTVVVGSCVGNESPTGTGGEAALDIQPALIATPADGDALPINRIRVSAARISDGLLVAERVTDVSPTDASWTLDVDVPAPYASSTVYVFVWLVHVASDGTEAVQFSGRSDAIELVPGEALAPDIPIVRGPVANLFTTGVSITSAPGTLAVGSSITLTADVTTSGTDTPVVYWTSLNPDVSSVAGAAATGVAEGTAQIVASAGMFADTVSIQVVPVLTLETTSLPDATQGAPYSQTLTATGGGGAYTWTVSAGSLPAGLGLDPSSGVISGTPTAVETASFTAQVTSGDGQTATRPLSINVVAPTGGVVQWAAGVDGNWSVASNWSPARVPQAGDSVVIAAAGPYTVTVDQAAEAATMVLGGASASPILELAGAPLTLAELTVASGATVAVTQPTTLTGTVTHGGTLDVAASLDLFGDLVTSSTVSIASGMQLSLQGGTLVYDGGAFSGQGELRFLEGATGTFNADWTTAGLDVTVSGGGMLGTGLVTVSPTSTVGVYGATVDAPLLNEGTLILAPATIAGPLENRGTLTAQATISGPLTTTSSSSIEVGLDGFSLRSLTVTDGFTNNGTLTLTNGISGVSAQQGSELVLTNGPLVNGPGGVIVSEAGSGGGSRTVTGDLDLRGTVQADYPLTVEGQLIVPATDDAVIQGTGGDLTVAGLDVDGLAVTGVPLRSFDGVITRFDNVTLDVAPTQTALNILHPGAPSPFVFDGVIFVTTPTTGLYVAAADDSVDGNTLTIEFTNSTPADGSAYELEQQGAVINWSTAPATLVTWTGGGDGTSWSDANNWSSAAVPTSGDSVVIQGTPNDIALDVDANVRSVILGGSGSGTQTLTASGADLRASGSILVDSAAVLSVGPADSLWSGGQITVSAGGSLALDASTVDAPLDQRGTMTVRGATTVSGQLTTATTSNVLIEGFGGVEGALAVASGFTNNGLIDLADTNGGNATLSVQGTLVNSFSGTLRVSASVGGYARALFGVLDNRGGVDVSEAFTLEAPSGTHLNSGLISVGAGTFSVNLNQASFSNESGGTLTLSGTGDLSVFYPSSGAPSFSQDGLITIGTGRTLLLSGAAGSFDIFGGSITNLGLLDVAGVPQVNSPAFLQTGSGTLRLNTTTWNGSGTLRNPPGATLDLRNAVIDADVENRGQIAVYGATINGRLTVPNTEVATFSTPTTPYALTVGDVDVDGAVFDRAVLRVDGLNLTRLDNVTFQNQDQFTTQLWVTHPGVGSPFTFDSVTFDTAGEQYIRATDASTDADTLTIVLTNSTPADGSLNTTTDNGAIVYWGAPAPTLNVWTGLGNDGLWSTSANWSGGVPTAYDSVVVDASAADVTLDQTASIQSLTLDALDVGATLHTNGFDLTTAANVSITSSNVLEVTGGTVAVGGVVSVASPASLVLDGGTIDGPLDNQGTLSVTDTSAVTGAVATTSSSLIDVTGQVGLTGWLTVSGDLVNYGIIRLNGADGAAALTTGGTLVNDVDANILVSPGASGGFLLTALENHGVVEFEGLLGLVGPPGAAHTNTGLINGVAGNLSIALDGGSFVNQNGASVALAPGTNSSIQLSNGAVFTNEGSVSVAAAASLTASGAGTLDMSTGSWNNSGLTGMTSGITVAAPSILTNYGVDATLVISDATWSGGGTLINGQGAKLQAGLATLDTDLVNQSTMELVADVTVTGQLTVPDTSAAAFVGSGVLTVGGASVVGATFTGVPLVIDMGRFGGSITALQNLAFNNMATSATQLTVTHPGPAGFDFSSLTFMDLVDGDTGFYVAAIDSAENGSTFDINMSTNPGNGDSFTNAVAAGNDPIPVVNWP